MEQVFQRVLAEAELADNQAKAITLEGHELLVCRSKGQVFVVQNQCTHQRAALTGGRVRNCHVACPLHGVMFDLRTGKPKGTLTNIPLKTYETRVNEGFIEALLA